MNWLKKFMMGRYGGDQLSMGLVLLSALITLISSTTNLQILILLGYIPLGLGIFRMFSKNIQKRQMENYKFAILVSPVYSLFNKGRNRVKDAKTHRFFKCPKCKAKLRLPKGKGKISITCPKCNAEFIKKT